MGKYYTKNQAFNHAYEKAKKIDSDKNHEDGPFRTRHLNYSSTNQEKIRNAPNSSVVYIYWFDELYKDSQNIILKQQELYKNIEKAKTKKKVNYYFSELYKALIEINEYKNECNEFQRCIVATEITDGLKFAEMLQDQLKHIDLIETRITQTGDRKLLSINNSRIQFIGLSLSLTAIVVSLVSIFMNS